MTESFGERVDRWRRAVDLTRLRYVGIGAYFLCYALIAAGLVGFVDRLLRTVPASIRPLPIAPVATTVGLPASVSWGVVSFVVACLAVVGVAAVQIRRHEEPRVSSDWEFGRVTSANSVTDGGVSDGESATARGPGVDGEKAAEDDEKAVEGDDDNRG